MIVLTLVLVYSYCKDNIKYGLLSKHLFQRKLKYSGWKSLTVTVNF